MTEAEWLTATDPRPMLEFLPNTPSNRKLRLLVVACCRQFWNSLRDDAKRPTTARWHKRVRALFSEWQLDDPILPLEAAERGLEVAEQFADRLVREPKLEAAGHIVDTASSGLDQIVDLIINERLPQRGRERTERERFALHFTGIAISYRPSTRNLIDALNGEEIIESDFGRASRQVTLRNRGISLRSC